MLVSGTQDVPSNAFSEYAVINNGGIVTVSSSLSVSPLAVFIGGGGTDSGTVKITSGSLEIDHLDLLNNEFPLGNVGNMVVGLGGTGVLEVSGGTLTLGNSMIVSGGAGGSGTLKLSGTGEIIANAGSSIGAGGGEAALWAMTGGSFIQAAGDLNIADDGDGSTAVFNMSGDWLMFRLEIWILLVVVVLLL